MEWILATVGAIVGAGLTAAAAYRGMRNLVKNGNLAPGQAPSDASEPAWLPLIQTLIESRPQPVAAPEGVQERVESLERRISAIHEEIVTEREAAAADRKRAEGARARAEQLRREREESDDEEGYTEEQRQAAIDSARGEGYNPNEKRDPRAELEEIEGMAMRGEI